MSTKIFTPYFLRLEREIDADVNSVWRALVDVHELRAWWGRPVSNFEPDVGGGFKLRYVGSPRVDTFEFTVWDDRWRIGGEWRYNSLEGFVDEMLCLVSHNGKTRVSIEQGNFKSFNKDQQRIFGYHKSELRHRLERLQEWCEKRIPATMASS